MAHIKWVPDDETQPAVIRGNNCTLNVLNCIFVIEMWVYSLVLLVHVVIGIAAGLFMILSNILAELQSNFYILIGGVCLSMLRRIR